MSAEGEDFLAPAAGGVLVRLHVTPKASRTRIEGVRAEADGTQALRVAVGAAPEGGKANEAVVKMLAKAWRLPKTVFSVRAGATARRKVLFIEGDAGELARRIREGVETGHG